MYNLHKLGFQSIVQVCISCVQLMQKVVGASCYFAILRKLCTSCIKQHWLLHKLCTLLHILCPFCVLHNLCTSYAKVHPFHFMQVVHILCTVCITCTQLMQKWMNASCITCTQVMQTVWQLGPTIRTHPTEHLFIALRCVALISSTCRMPFAES